MQYDNDSSFTFYDSAPPPVRPLSPHLLPLEPQALSPHPLASISDLSEQRIDLNLISVLDSPVSEPPLSPLHQQREYNVYEYSVRPPMPFASQQSTVVRNLSPYFAIQCSEAEFAPSPTSTSSSSLGCDLENSFPGFNMAGVQDLLLNTSNNCYDFNMDSFTVTDWVEKTLSEVINQNF